MWRVQCKVPCGCVERRKGVARVGIIGNETVIKVEMCLGGFRNRVVNKICELLCVCVWGTTINVLRKENLCFEKSNNINI